jgi:hypothetical protein
MRRWQVTAGLVVLAGIGVTLATGLPAGVVAIGQGRTLLVALWDAVVPDLHHDPDRGEPLPTIPEVTPIGTVAEPPPTTIPELSEPIRPIPSPRVVLPPDPEPVHYGCGGRPVPADAPMPACGMG